MERRTTTPSKLTERIKDFCHKIVPDTQPIYLPIQPIENSMYGECYQNVENAITIMGGKRVLGWNIWLWTNILIEAEAHAVLEKSDGEYIDVTPQRDNELQVLFLPDNSLHYEGRYIKSIRQPLTDSPLVAEFLEVMSRIDEIILQSPKNAIEVPKDLADHYVYLLSIFRTKVGRNDPCPCQSGLKYKKCCGR